MIVVSLFLSHLISDYLLQWDSLARWKSRELKVVLEALTGSKTPGQIAKMYRVHPNSIGW